MSTQSPAIPSAEPSALPTSTQTSSLSSTSTLLFGFLISALSIFAIFTTVAIVWNRLVVRRRALDTMWTMSPQRPKGLHRPAMWDVWVTPDKQPHLWADVKPVAVQKSDFPASPPRTSHTVRTISFWRHRLLNCLPPEITYLFRRPVPQASTASSDPDLSHVELSHGSDIHILLLICMPRAPQPEREQGFHEMAFATTVAVHRNTGLS